jgi:hypothetical protein
VYYVSKKRFNEPNPKSSYTHGKVGRASVCTLFLKKGSINLIRSPQNGRASVEFIFFLIKGSPSSFINSKPSSHSRSHATAPAADGNAERFF